MKSEVWQEGDLFLPTNLRYVGFVFQEPSLFTHLTVQGNMLFGVKRRGQMVDDNDFAEIVRLLDLEACLVLIQANCLEVRSNEQR